MTPVTLLSFVTGNDSYSSRVISWQYQCLIFLARVGTLVSYTTSPKSYKEKADPILLIGGGFIVHERLHKRFTPAMNQARAVCRFGKWFAVAGVGRLGSFIRHRQFHGIGYPVKLSSEVVHALVTGRPVVALESTIITHGMPYPQNVETAERVENVVRSKVIVVFAFIF